MEQVIRKKSGRKKGVRHPQLAEILKKLQGKCGYLSKFVYLYGSQMRADAIAESDIDIMVLENKAALKVTKSYCQELEEEYQVPICVQYGEIAVYKNSYNAFWRELRGYAKILSQAISQIESEKTQSSLEITQSTT